MLPRLNALTRVDIRVTGTIPVRAHRDAYSARAVVGYASIRYVENINHYPINIGKLDSLISTTEYQ